MTVTADDDVLILFSCLVYPGVDHTVLTQVGEQFLNIRSGMGTVGTKVQYRGGDSAHTNTHTHTPRHELGTELTSRNYLLAVRQRKSYNILLSPFNTKHILSLT